MPAPEKVFTPRSPDVNPEMYITRSNHEKALERALRGAKNIVIFGESGCGKSWLYKSKLAQLKASYMTANMANVSRLGSVTSVFADRFAKLKQSAVKSTSKSISAGINLGPIQVGAEVVREAEHLHSEPFERCLHALGGLQTTQRRFIVIENIESVIEDEDHVKDIAGLITLIDDEDYAIYDTKLILVGVPDDIQRYLSKSVYGQTISNRIVEVPEVERLQEGDAIALLKRGFVDLLNYEVEESANLTDLAWHADYIPQHLHEVGLEIAFLADNDKIVNSNIISEGIKNWIRTTFMADYTAIEAKMNSRETKAGRRNQTIYTVAHTDKSDFKVSDIELELRAHFPNSTDNIALNINQMLAELADQPTPIIRRTPKGDAFRFVNPKVKVCIRGMLRKTVEEKVEKVPLEQAG